MGTAGAEGLWSPSRPTLSITILGTGAKWLSVLEEKDLKPGESVSQPCPCSARPGVTPRSWFPCAWGAALTSWRPFSAAETHNLQTLHTILSTGSPLKAQSYEYVYRCIKSSVLLGSISGTSARSPPTSCAHPARCLGLSPRDPSGARILYGPCDLGPQTLPRPCSRGKVRAALPDGVLCPETAALVESFPKEKMKHRRGVTCLRPHTGRCHLSFKPSHPALCRAGASALLAAGVSDEG